MARRGRPTKAPDPGGKASLGLKVTPALKTRLELEAQQSGRTQSQEAEFRLERSFDRQDLLTDALVLAYGPKLAEIIQALAQAMATGATIYCFTPGQVRG